MSRVSSPARAGFAAILVTSCVAMAQAPAAVADASAPARQAAKQAARSAKPVPGIVKADRKAVASKPSGAGKPAKPPAKAAKPEDIWTVVDRTAEQELSGSRNTAKYRSQSSAKGGKKD